MDFLTFNVSMAPTLTPPARPAPSTPSTRLLLHGRIAHVQAAWPKFGPGLTEAVLRGGADDVGGLLLDGVLDPSAGAEAGRALTLAEVEALAADLGRTPRQRTTVYGDPPADRVAVLRGDTP